MLDFRNTPGQDGFSPVQKLMSRRTKTRLPTTKKLLSPRVAKGVSRKINENKQKQADYYNQNAKDLKPLQLGDHVLIYDFQNKQWSTKGMIVKRLPYRSYVVKLSNGRNLKRNRKHLKKTYQHVEPVDDDDDEPPGQPAAAPAPGNQPVQPATCQQDGTNTAAAPVRTRSGRMVTPPAYLQDYQQ